MIDWSAIARQVIGEVHKTLSPDATYAERKKALFAAYPFGQRTMWPYKAWCQAQKNYLWKYAPHDSKRMPLSPLERMMLKTT